MAAVAPGSNDEPARREEVSWLAGARVLVTGAAGSLGQSLVAEAHAQGATVTASGREPAISQTAVPSGVEVIASDLGDPSQCLRLPAAAAARMGGLDVLVNNAAVLIRKKFTDLSVEELDEAWAVNLRAPVLLMQASLPFLREGNAAAIVNIVSSAGGIRVNCLSPPTFDSRMQDGLTAEERARVQELNLLDRRATPREVARITLFLASSQAHLLTGTMLDATAFVS
jgi:NAD(P)-dependent dehydrogenase (short-subunit alcohol dehydrogenase family)